MARRKDNESVVKRLKARFKRTFERIGRQEPSKIPGVPETLENFHGSTIFPLTVDEQGNDSPFARASEGIPPAPPRGTLVSLAQVGEAIDRLASRPFTVKRDDLAVSFIIGDQERITENARRVAARMSRRGESK